jgi:hypothetical protein
MADASRRPEAVARRFFVAKARFVHAWTKRQVLEIIRYPGKF